MLSLPFNSSSTVMWINKDALKKAGITEIPKTWPEVFEAAKKLKKDHPTCGFSNAWGRSEEHTSELQSRLHGVCRLLLEKNKLYDLPVTAPKVTKPETINCLLQEKA